jgi:hypothetical protein
MLAYHRPYFHHLGGIIGEKLEPWLILYGLRVVEAWLRGRAGAAGSLWGRGAKMTSGGGGAVKARGKI